LQAISDKILENILNFHQKGSEETDFLQVIFQNYSCKKSKGRREPGTKIKRDKEGASSKERSKTKKASFFSLV
jgi:hypothetical protein